jgi:hypothetical protein
MHHYIRSLLPSSLPWHLPQHLSTLQADSDDSQPDGVACYVAEKARAGGTTAPRQFLNNNKYRVTSPFFVLFFFQGPDNLKLDRSLERLNSVCRQLRFTENGL